MSDERRSIRRFVIVALAVPSILSVYVVVFGSRLGRGLRLAVAGLAGVTVIGSVYADEALRRVPARATPIRAAAAMALAVMLAGASLSPAPAAAAKPADQMIAAAREYLGVPYRLGAVGPKRFDCSGLIFRVFADAGHLPRVSGKRLRAVGYFRWFSTRGLASKEGRRGDLVVYDGGTHIGIYLGGGKVISALTSGVATHGLREIGLKVTAFLNVRWNKDYRSKAGAEADGNKKDKKDRQKDDNDSGDADGPAHVEGRAIEGSDAEADSGRRLRGVATGTLNLRRAPGPDEKITGIVSRDSTFKVLGTGTSPSGAPWLNVRLANGKTGWIWAHWTRVQDR